MSAIMFLQMCRVSSWAEHGVKNLMDNQQDKECASEDQETVLINGVKEDGKGSNYSNRSAVTTSAFFAQRSTLNGVFLPFPKIVGWDNN